MKPELEKYISSGVIEMYCLGMVSPTEAKELEQLSARHPVVRAELEAAQTALLGFAGKYEREPSESMGAQILNDIEELKFATAGFSSETGMLKQFIDVSEFSDTAKWEKLIEGISPGEAFDNRTQVPLYESDSEVLAVMWVKQKIDPEIHDDRVEKILVLEGECTCRLGNKYVDLKPGDCFVVPLNTVHDLTVTSEEMVKLIYVRQMVEAA